MTNITLIPKGETQTSLKDWRLITLCNVLYKVIAKVLANRLKKVLFKCISDNQSAFVSGRSILDNAMAAIEVVHHMKTKTKGKIGEIALKLDISKAYDKIDWDYIRDFLITMGFSQNRNVGADVKAVLAATLGVQQVLGTDKYLGVPSMIGRSKKATIKYIKDRIWKKINSWSSRCLSQAVRETLIKSELQAIPSYIMNIFLLPSSLSDEIEKMMNSFWRGHNRDRAKGFHWLSWDRLSMTKKNGGMGFKNLSAFNYAMLGKQVWNLMTKPDSLVTRLYKAKYYPNCDFLESSIGHNPSYVWRSIWSSKFVVGGWYKWSVGSGESIPTWGQIWLHDSTSLMNPWPNNPVISRLKVSDLMQPNVKQWNTNLIYSLVGEGLAEIVLNTPLFGMVLEDKTVWKLERNGDYSVANQEQQAVFATTLWSLWKCRNNHVWNQIEDSQDTICNRSINLLHGGRRAQHIRNNNISQSQSPMDPKWSKPSTGSLKCNIDASFSNNKVGLGTCIRDDKCSFIAARTEWFSPIT
ncbi:uncharacterized protein LOC131633933 [Vicia villosa]|uniref:uncharacterized protein LOC131633933 n=1 Tax=Vicia villosa TaxID=3911 RepID=UPI00273B3831|nr:uncharacterized protein LOC131633933 [Vicia villosa]